MLTYISIEKAKEVLDSQPLKPELEEVPILESLDMILGQDIKSTMNMPPFDRSPLDGYALRSEDTQAATHENPITFQVIDNIQAGYVSDKIIGENQAIRIMTGAKIPQGADAIIAYEKTDFTKDQVKLFNCLKPQSNIVKMGEDMGIGDLVIEKGKKISPADIGIMATLGISKVKVIKKPIIGILATGDELVDVEEDIGDGKIRNSNSYTLASQVKKLGGQPLIFGICKDDIETITKNLNNMIDKCHMIITTGGVSVGDADVVKEAFQEIGGQLLFWKVNMKPGTPIAVAIHKNKLLFGLSGNPAAAAITFEQFVRPSILRLRGIKNNHLMEVETKLLNDFTKTSPQNRFVRGRTFYKDGEFFTELPDKHSSGVLSSLSATNSLFLVESNKGPYFKGDKVQVQLLYPLEGN